MSVCLRAFEGLELEGVLRPGPDGGAHAGLGGVELELELGPAAAALGLGLECKYLHPLPKWQSPFKK